MYHLSDDVAMVLQVLCQGLGDHGPRIRLPVLGRPDRRLLLVRGLCLGLILLARGCMCCCLRLGGCMGEQDRLGNAYFSQGHSMGDWDDCLGPPRLTQHTWGQPSVWHGQWAASRGWRDTQGLPVLLLLLHWRCVCVLVVCWEGGLC